MFRIMSTVCLSLIALGFVSGCVIDGSESGANAPIETQTVTQEVDRDATQKGALGLIFGMSQIDDKLDCTRGDCEDWRYIVVTEPGVMALTLNVDHPNDIKGSWNIIDAEGRSRYSAPIEKDRTFYELKDFPVVRGVYYFQMMATSGTSVYTIGATFKPTPPIPVVADNSVEDDDDNPPPTPSSGTKPKPKPKPKPVTDDPPKPKPKPDPPPPPKPATKKMVGYIAGITPKPDGSAEITIRDVGKNKGMEAGMSGVIEGTSLKIKTKQCFPTSCKAIIPESADPKKLKQGANVVFEIPIKE